MHKRINSHKFLAHKYATHHTLALHKLKHNRIAQKSTYEQIISQFSTFVLSIIFAIVCAHIEASFGWNLYQKLLHKSVHSYSYIYQNAFRVDVVYGHWFFSIVTAMCCILICVSSIFIATAICVDEIKKNFSVDELESVINKQTNRKKTRSHMHACALTKIIIINLWCTQYECKFKQAAIYIEFFCNVIINIKYFYTIWVEESYFD